MSGGEPRSAVAVKDLQKRFGRFVAVNRLTFDVPAGQVFGFLGPNGAGKSTTIRMLCGILAPSGGEGTVAGLDLRTQAEEIKSHIGYMSQRFSLYEGLTVEENIDFYSGIYRLPSGRRRQRKAWVIRMAGLETHRRALTGTLSGGWKQRLALGCALLHEPPIVFLDEPTSGVDPISRRQFWDLIYELAEGGTTVFVTTHYLDEAEYCDRIGLIYRGELIASGTPGDLKTAFMQEEVLEVLCERPIDAMEAVETAAGVREVALFGRGLHVVTEDAAASAEAIRGRLAERGFPAARVAQIVPSLEDVFVSLIEARDRAADEAAGVSHETSGTMWQTIEEERPRPDARCPAGPRRVWAIARKEFIHIIRDPRSLGIAVAIPVLMLVLFGWALTLDVDRVPMVIWDQSGSPASRDLASRFAGSRYFAIRGYARSYREVERAIDARAALAALVIPTDFAGRVGSGRSARAQLIVDGSDANTATLALGYADAVVQAHSVDLLSRDIRRAGGQVPQTPVDLRPRVWFNAEMESRNSIVPGLVAVIMAVVAALLTSLTVAREWEVGTMEHLIATPLRATELVLGKLLPYFGVGMFDVLLAVLMGKFLFRVPLRGSPALVFGISAVFLAGALSLGLLVSILAKSQLVANQLAMVLTFLPSFLLSGFVYSIANMPAPIRWITRLIPARYFIAALRSIYLKGVGLEIVALEAGLLALFGAGVVVVAAVTFRKRLA